MGRGKAIHLTAGVCRVFEREDVGVQVVGYGDYEEEQD